MTLTTWAMVILMTHSNGGHSYAGGVATLPMESREMCLKRVGFVLQRSSVKDAFCIEVRK